MAEYPPRFDVGYLDDQGDWQYAENGGDTLSTAERRGKMEASRRRRLVRVLKDGVEQSRWVHNPYSRAGDSRLRAKKA